MANDRYRAKPEPRVVYPTREFVNSRAVEMPPLELVGDTERLRVRANVILNRKKTKMEGKTWPHVGDRLVHRFRKKPGEVIAEVIAVEKKTGRVALRIGNKVFQSLSTAAEAVSGSVTNGWIYWGLKKQRPTRSRQ